MCRNLPLLWYWDTPLWKQESQLLLAIVSSNCLKADSDSTFISIKSGLLGHTYLKSDLGCVSQVKTRSCAQWRSCLKLPLPFPASLDFQGSLLEAFLKLPWTIPEASLNLPRSFPEASLILPWSFHHSFRCGIFLTPSLDLPWTFPEASL